MSPWISQRLRYAVRTSLLGSLLLLGGCAETVYFRSSPSGARVFVNESEIGLTPVRFSTRDIDSKEFSYRVEKDEYPSATGVLGKRIAAGRVVGTVFTFGILRAFRSLRCFAPDRIDVVLEKPGPKTERVAVLRLFDIKAATVLEGECDGQSECWVRTASGDLCQGQYLKESKGTTTVTAGGTNVAGFGSRLGWVGGSVNSLSTGSEVANSISGVAVMRCPGNIIDCSLTLEAFKVQGFGQCKDSKGREYRATLAVESRTVEPE